MPLDPDNRRQFAKTGRLWLLALVCATVGSVTVWRTDNLGAGVLAFLATLALLGTASGSERSCPLPDEPR